MIGALEPAEGPLRAGLAALRHRGPDAEAIRRVGRVALGHARLAVIDPTPASDQPFTVGDVTLAYNGECWNFRALRSELEEAGRTFATSGDVEVVAAALDEWGLSALPKLDGMFAMAWTTDGERVHLARDRFGEVPLHLGRLPDGDLTDGPWFASEMKALVAAGAMPIGDVGPGEVVTLGGTRERRRWYEPSAEPVSSTPAAAAAATRELLAAGTVERAEACDVPACTLLSGGIDSAAVALHLSGVIEDLTAYVAVLDEKARDLRCARLVAEWLAIPLVEVAVEPPTADDLARVVAEIEMPHKAQVEIGWACLRLAEAMRADGFKVTYSGEGSDELWASYGMSYHGVKKEGWHGYRKHLFLDQARKNFARCNKVFMARSVEVRLPFLHRPLVEAALSFPREVVVDGSRPKAVMERAHEGLLPPEVLRRPKVAFQDGMKLKEACAEAVAEPARFYRAEFRRLYGSAA